VLQGVAPEDTKLKDSDKELFERWTHWNYDRYWRGASKADGHSPIDVDLVVIDDPQREWTRYQIEVAATEISSVTALIPLIKRDSPRTKIIYRSHIESKSKYV
jgi:hypothetical protein